MRTPHSPPGDPVVGTALRFARAPLEFLETLAATYANGVVHLSGPAGPGIYVVLDPALVQQVLTADHARYRKPQLRPELSDPLLGEGLLTSEGSLWRRQRDTLQPAFFTRRLREFADTVVDYTRRETEEWPLEETFDLYAGVSVITVRVVADLLLGVDLPRSDAVAVGEAMETVGETLAVSPLGVVKPPWLRTRPPRAYRLAIQRLEDVAGRIVAANDGEGDDVLGLLQRAREANPDAFSEDELRDQVLTFLLAGHETTALTLTYACWLLSQNPDTADRLHAEVDAVVDDSPTWADLPELEHTEQVVHETLRVLPPVWSLFREPLADSRLGEYRLPEGSPVMLPQWALHRSGRHWEAPAAFRPDRWSGRKPAETPAYFPFGAGPRACIGRQLSIVEAKLVLAELFSQFDLTVTAEELPRRAGITMQPEGAVPATAIPR